MSSPRIRPWLLAHLPAGVKSLSAEWFLAILCLLTGQAILTGVGRSSSVELLLYPVAYYLWSACLLVGGLALISGLSSIRQVSDSEYVIRRTPVYLLGLRLLGTAAFFYAVAVLIINGWDAIVSAAVTLAFAGLCAVRILVVGGKR